MQTIPISSILVSDRQRKDLGDLDRDFLSVKEIGLIQPIVLDVIQSTPESGIEMVPIYKLKVGGRRLAWLQKNGFTELFHGTSCDPKRPGYILSNEVNERQRQEAELLENLNRHALNWREECCGIAKVHRQRWIENKADGLEWSQKHTARLLNIDGYAKIGYALDIADDIRDNPEGEIAKCERYSDAVKLLISRTEQKARQEQERRREILRKIEEKMQPDLVVKNEDGTETVLPPPNEPEQPQEKVCVNLTHMCRLGDFSTIAAEEFPPDMYPCALVFDASYGWKEQTLRLLKADSYLVLCFMGTEMVDHFPQFHETVIWNQLGLDCLENCAFRDSTKIIGLIHKGQPVSPCPSPTNVVSANPEEDGSIPAAVLDFILRATTIPGDTIILPRSGPVKTILDLGRRPICFDTDPALHEAHKEQVREYYTNLYSDNVEFI